jgi:hypothetical protein
VPTRQPASPITTMLRGALIAATRMLVQELSDTQRRVASSADSYEKLLALVTLPAELCERVIERRISRLA